MQAAAAAHCRRAHQAASLFPLNTLAGLAAGGLQILDLWLFLGMIVHFRGGGAVPTALGRGTWMNMTLFPP